MNCPRCKVALNEKKFKDIDVDHCPQCKGLWLEFHELDQLEDHSMDSDDTKGMLEYARRESDISCPHCDELMETFNYRAHNLPIDHCTNEHGYWLDEGEEKKVLDIMKQRVRDLKRSVQQRNLGPNSWNAVVHVRFWPKSRICSPADRTSNSEIRHP